jgi:hypothetical protein
MSDDRWIIVPHWDKFQHYPTVSRLDHCLHELNSSDEWWTYRTQNEWLLVTI